MSNRPKLRKDIMEFVYPDCGGDVLSLSLSSYIYSYKGMLYEPVEADDSRDKIAHFTPIKHVSFPKSEATETLTKEVEEKFGVRYHNGDKLCICGGTCWSITTGEFVYNITCNKCFNKSILYT